MKLGSNITVKNVLKVYVTTTTIFYAISLKNVRTSHTLTGEGWITRSRFNMIMAWPLKPTPNSALQLIMALSMFTKLKSELQS